jgi:hypothetical protein
VSDSAKLGLCTSGPDHGRIRLNLNPGTCLLQTQWGHICRNRTRAFFLHALPGRLVNGFLNVFWWWPKTLSSFSYSRCKLTNESNCSSEHSSFAPHYFHYPHFHLWTFHKLPHRSTEAHAFARAEAASWAQMTPLIAAHVRSLGSPPRYPKCNATMAWTTSRSPCLRQWCCQFHGLARSKIEFDIGGNYFDVWVLFSFGTVLTIGRCL